MSEYRFPQQDALFVLHNLISFKALADRAGFSEFSEGLAESVLEEAAKLGEQVLAPLNRPGDLAGAELTDNGVKECQGFADAYQQFCEGGWPALSGPQVYGGQGLPEALSVAVNEVWQSSNLAWALCPLLTQSGVLALQKHASDELKQQYLEKLVTGEWVATMNLTEPDAGSDLAALKTKAVPEGNYYRIRGQKIFITWGDHQMTDNILHMVLARLPDAPGGVKGISLFLVPKFLLDAEGNLTAEKNDLKVVSLEHKLGIHGSPTCVMSYGDEQGAVGYLVGEPHQGLACMFSMMNDARQGVGLQGLAIAERASQQAVSYARERMQGYDSRGERVAIIKHPDVRRMLMQMRALTEAMRALAYVARAELDFENLAEDNHEAIFHARRTALYTPIVKGWMTEVAQEVTGLAIQVHGGTGFIEETGVAQHYRDARILTIYEGTTGIQALDLLGRKLLHDSGLGIGQLFEEIESDTKAVDASLQSLAVRVDKALLNAIACKEYLLQQHQQGESALTAQAVSYLMLLGYLCGGWLSLKSAHCALLQMQQQEDHTFYQAKITTAQFYCEQILSRVDGLSLSIQSGVDSTMQLPDEMF